MELFKKPAAHIFVIISLGILAYSNSLHVPFLFDDRSSISENPVIKNIDNFTYNSHGYAAYSQRYVGYLSFALNYRYGGLHVISYHITNLVIHIINAILIYLFVILTFKTDRLRGSDISNSAAWIALSTSILFTVHPIETEAVIYVVQRLTSLAVLFYLASLLSFIKARLVLRQENSNRVVTVVLYVLSLVFAVLAMKTKEIAFTLPLIAALYEFFFFEGRMRRRITFLFPMLLMLLIIPLSLLSFHKPTGNLLSDIGAITTASNLPRWDYLLTQFGVVVTYIRLLLFPVNQNLDYDYPIAHSLFEPRVLGSLLLILLILAGAALMLKRPGRGSTPALRLASFGILWFFITLSVESSFIPILDVIFEHRVYLPSVGIFLAIASLSDLVSSKRWIAGRKVPPLIAGVAVVLALMVTTIHRNSVWASEVRLWQDSVDKSPGKPRTHYNLGKAYTDLGLTDKAIDEYQAALKLDPDYADARNNLGLSYLSKGSADEAIRECRAALNMNPEDPDYHDNLGMVYLEKGLMDKATEEFRAALKLKPDDPKAHNNLGISYSKVGLADRGIDEFRNAIKLNPDYAEAYFNLGYALSRKGANEEAIEELEEAAKFAPSDPETRNQLGIAYASSGRMSKALEEFQSALSLRPDDKKFQENLQNAERMSGMQAPK